MGKILRKCGSFVSCLVVAVLLVSPGSMPQWYGGKTRCYVQVHPYLEDILCDRLECHWL